MERGVFIGEGNKEEEQRAGKLYSSLPVPESTIITTIMTTKLFNKDPLFGASNVQTVQSKNLGMDKDLKKNHF